MASPTSALSFADGARSFSLRRSASGPGLAYRRAVPSRACGGALLLTLFGGHLSTFLLTRDAACCCVAIDRRLLLNGRNQVELDVPTFLCYRRTCGGALFLLPSRWLSKHLPLRDAACDAFALDRCRLLRWQGPDWTNAPTFLCFRRACVRWLVFPTPPLGGCLSTFLSVMPPVTRLHLIGAVFCDGRGQIGLTHRRSCAFDGRACGGLFFLLPSFGG